MVEQVSESCAATSVMTPDSVDRSTVDGCDLVELIRARCRLIAAEHGRLLADLVALVDQWRAPDTPAVLAEGAMESAALEVATALRWTHRAAEAWLALAEDTVRRLPAVHAALLAGGIDLPRARVFCHELSAADDAVATQVVDRLLPQAGTLTTGQLGARIRKLLAATDPDSAEKRYRQAVEQRGMHATADADGCVQIAAWGLPAARAAAAVERIDAMAKAARTAGDRRSMDQLRADTFLGLLAGDYDGPTPVHRRGVVELTVPLTTLAGLDQQPGELAGFGPVIADVARQVTAAQRDTATWRYSVVDGEGRVVYHGITRRRPVAADAAMVRARDRRCVFPGCRVPASRCDLDHRRRYADGGPTVPSNLQPLCRRHHRAKDEGGWRVFVMGDGHYLWTSPLRFTHEVKIEPLVPP